MKKIYLYAKDILKIHVVALSSVLVLIFIIEIFALLTPYLFGETIDSLKINSEGRWRLHIFLMGAAIACNALVSYLKAIIDVKYYIFDVDMDFELLAMKHVLKFPVGQLRADNTGEIQSVIQKGITSFSEYIKLALFNILPTLVFSIVTLIWLFFISFEMFLIALGFIIISLVYMYYTNDHMKDRFVETRTKWQKIDAHRMEVIRNASLVIFYDQAKEILNEYGKRYSKVKKRGINDWSYYLKRIYLMKILHVVAMVGVLVLGAKGVINQSYTAGEFVVIYSWLSSVFSKTSSLMQSFRYIMRYTPNIIKYFEMTEKPIELDEYGSREEISYGKISFSNVSYNYKSRSGVKKIKQSEALNNVSFTLEVGESLGVVGRSGAGKSTLVNLLMRSYDPISGGIFIDNIPLSDYASSYKRDVGYIEQRPKLFDDTVRYNLLFGLSDKAGITDDEIFDTLRLVGLDQKIQKLPNGLESRIGEQGVKFSGGEAQRLSIAGVLLKKPKLLILDEATSALDELSQVKIKEAVEKIGKNATSIIIAHRLSTISHCDKVLVLDNGEIDFFGTFKEAKESSQILSNMIEESKIKNVS